jgi:GT2 family glycosyltransferase
MTLLQSAIDISVVIPTFGREQVLLDTLRCVLDLDPPPAEVLVVDQTPQHETATSTALESYHDSGAIRWIRLREPSIPRSMNRGLRDARSSVVLFLDDDVIPQSDLLRKHIQNYGDEKVWAVTGQVLQPGETPGEDDSTERGDGLWRDLQFQFWSTQRCEVANCMAGNLSVRRERALALGGFDLNYVGVAYRFETDFCRRLTKQGGKMLFEPSASLFHLRAARGGTRAYGNHLRSHRPEHSVGDYYFALKEGVGWQRAYYIVRRMFREARTRYHLSHPWWIPVKLTGEVRGLYWAVQLRRQGPRYLACTEPVEETANGFGKLSHGTEQ